MKRLAEILLLSLVVVGSAACASDVATLDRTQPNKLSKSIFNDGDEWFFRPQIIDVDYNQGFLFEGVAGSMERIKWDIQRDFLIAYRSYELLEGAERVVGDRDFRGNPVAAFPIISHFDIVRDFNPATGEQNNVVRERQDLRPWWEREYMRVDWSINAQGAYGLPAALTAFSGAPFFVQEHEVDSPYKPEITENNINVVGNYILSSDVYSCWAYFDDPAFCGQSDVKMKLSFMKVGERDYQTLYYPDVIPARTTDNQVPLECFSDGSCEKDTIPVFERFGFFRHERLSFDENFQFTRDGRIYLGHRWNIWAQSSDANGEPIAPELRRPGTITFYTNVDWPDYDEGDPNSIWNASQRIAQEWDCAFKETVVELKRQASDPFADMNTVFGDAEDCTQHVDGETYMFELKKNDCNVDNVANYAAANGYNELLAQNGIEEIQRGNIKRACSLLESFSDGDFVWQKPGDLRYSFFAWADTPAIRSPLGYGPSFADPLTGEIISASAYVYGASVDSAAAYAADVLALINDQLDVSDVIDGLNIRDDVRTNEIVREQFEASSQRVARSIDPSKLNINIEKLIDAREQIFGGNIPKPKKAFYNQRMMTVNHNYDQPLEDAIAGDISRGTLDRVMGSQLEKEVLLNDDLKRAFLGPEGYQPGTGISAPEGFSALNEFMTEDLEAYQEIQRMAAKENIMMADPTMAFTDSGMLSIAKELGEQAQNQPDPWQFYYDFIRAQLYRGVMAHEVGHTLGLRHNFAGSIDPLNYHEEFWDSYNPTTQRVERVATAGNPVLTNPKYADLGLQVGDPTPAERYMYSTIMDYDARFYADSLQGIGPYDRAAIKFGYGNLVEVFEPGLAALGFENFQFLQDYHDLPKLFTGELACTSIETCNDDFLEADMLFGQGDQAADEADDARDRGDLVTFAQKNQEAEVAFEQQSRFLNSYWRTGLDSIVPQPQNLQRRTYVKLEDIQAAWSTYYNTGRLGLPDEVPYEFCPDERSWASLPDCQPWDKGANYMEITRDRMERYDQYYVFRNFKRDRWRFGFNPRSHVRSLYGRTFSPMSSVFRFTLFTAQDLGRDKDGRELSFADFPRGQDWFVAGHEGMNFLSQILEQPEPGRYCLDTVENTYMFMNDPEAACATNSIDVDPGVGKYFFTRWTNEYNYKSTRIGSFFDKWAVIVAMTDNTGFFYRDFSSFFDDGAFALSYWAGGLHDETLGIFNGAVNGGTGDYAWRFDDALQGVDRFQPLPVIDLYDTDMTAMQALPKIEANSSYTLRYYAALLPMARFNSFFDYSVNYNMYSRVCLDGNVDCVTFEDLGTEMYEDPLTGYRYIASVSDNPNRAIALNLIREARDYAEGPYQNAYDDYMATLDIDGEILPSFPVTSAEQALIDGGATFQDIAVERQITLQAREREVNERTSFIDIVRQMGGMIAGVY